MRIVHLLGWYFPDSVGGTEVYVEGLSRRLLDAGHQVLIAAPDTSRTAPHGYEHAGVSVFRYPVTRQPTRDESYHRVAMRGSEHLLAWLATERPDILHVHSIKTGIGLPELREARRLGIRIITTFHLPSLGYMCHTGELMEGGTHPCDGLVWPSKCAACSLTHAGLPPPASRITGALPPWLGRGVGRVPGKIGTVLGMSALVVDYQAMQRELFTLLECGVVLNGTASRMLLANGAPAAKIAINRLGVSQVPIHGKPGPDAAPTGRPVHVGFAGRLHPAKGLVEIVRAVRAIPRDVDFRLDIRGPILDSDARAFAADLRQLAADDPRVRFEPAVSSAEMPAVLTAIDVLLSPSVSFENGPTIALEAMAVGTPVIAANVGNLTEVITDGVNGRLVMPGSVDELAAALRDAVLHPESTIDVWRRSLPKVRTMDDVARDYMALYAA
jgi:glycosyltransferase involved in cell wall biosynthesis